MVALFDAEAGEMFKLIFNECNHLVKNISNQLGVEKANRLGSYTFSWILVVVIRL